MKLFEKIRRFIRGADRAVTNAICERLDNTAEKLENFARNLDPEAFQESKMRESQEGRPKTDPETAARLAQMPVASLEDAINQITEGIQYWERKGLKSVRKNPYVMYRQQDIIRYMKEHPEDWNAARVTDDTLFMQYPWFKEKRKNDISHKYNWTQTEVSQMKMLRKQGFTIREIAEKMNRSESSIKYKLYGREKSNGRS